MKKHAYLIIAHKNLNQVQRLINALDSSYNDIYIHVDIKYKEKWQIKSLTSINSELFVFSEIDVKWGDYSIVECEMLLLKAAIKNNYSYYHLLSGEDFPIKKIDYIYSFFEKSQKEFVHFTNNVMSKDDYDRVKYRHFFTKKFRSSKYKIINSFYLKLDSFFTTLQKIFRFQRKLYFNEYQKGSQWFSITSSFANYIVENEKIIHEAFKNTLIPDELFIQTIIINSDWKERIYNYIDFNTPIQNSRYIDWIRGNPYIFCNEDYDELMNTECCFGRKFSINTEDELVDKMEQYIKS